MFGVLCKTCIYESRFVVHYLMHHAVSRGTVVNWYTALCGATLHPPEVKSCIIILCLVHREHIVENCCDLLGFKCFQRLLSMQFIHCKSF